MNEPEPTIMRLKGYFSFGVNAPIEWNFTWGHYLTCDLCLGNRFFKNNIGITIICKRCAGRGKYMAAPKTYCKVLSLVKGDIIPRADQKVLKFNDFLLRVTKIG